MVLTTQPANQTTNNISSTACLQAKLKKQKYIAFVFRLRTLLQGIAYYESVKGKVSLSNNSWNTHVCCNFFSHFLHIITSS